MSIVNQYFPKVMDLTLGIFFMGLGYRLLKQQEELELELIDYGLSEMGESEDDKGNRILVIRCEFQEFGTMQQALENKNIEAISAETDWIPNSTISLDEEKAKEVMAIVDKLEQDEDVQRVFHNLI